MKKKVLFAVAAITMGIAGSQVVSGTPYTTTDVNAVVSMNDEVTYEKIETDDLPEVVSNAISEGYAAFSIDQAYEGTDGSYKVTVSSGDLKYDLFYSKEGDLSTVKDHNEE